MGLVGTKGLLLKKPYSILAVTGSAYRSCGAWSLSLTTLIVFRSDDASLTESGLGLKEGTQWLGLSGMMDTARGEK